MFILWKQGQWQFDFGSLDAATAEILLRMDHQYKCSLMQNQKRE